MPNTADDPSSRPKGQDRRVALPTLLGQFLGGKGDATSKPALNPRTETQGRQEKTMEIVEHDDPRLVFVPLDKAVVPPSGLIRHIKDHWWVTHPEKGLAFFDKKYMSPQCNSNKSVTEHIARMYPWAEIKFIPSVFRRIDLNDYVM